MKVDRHGRHDPLWVAEALSRYPSLRSDVHNVASGMAVLTAVVIGSMWILSMFVDVPGLLTPVIGFGCGWVLSKAMNYYSRKVVIEHVARLSNVSLGRSRTYRATTRNRNEQGRR